MSEINNEGNNEDHIIDEIIEVDLPATFNDLVEAEGFEPRVFKVFGYRIENWHTEEKSWVELVYELIDVINGDWLEADAEDIELLADAEDEAVYMATIDIENYPASFMATLSSESKNGVGGGSMAGKGDKPEKNLTPRELSAQEADRRKRERKEAYEAMNNELDRYNFFKSQYEKTKDRRYKESMDTVMAEIKKLASGDDKANVVGTDDQRKEE